MTMPPEDRVSSIRHSLADDEQLIKGLFLSNLPLVSTAPRTRPNHS